jgi:hypothetical protein
MLHVISQWIVDKEKEKSPSVPDGKHEMRLSSLLLPLLKRLILTQWRIATKHRLLLPFLQFHLPAPFPWNLCDSAFHDSLRVIALPNSWYSVRFTGGL